MTQQEFEQQYNEIDSQIYELKLKQGRLEDDYCRIINEPFKHLLKKKVLVKFVNYWGKTKQEISYWGGFCVNYATSVPMFYQIKKDGSMSTKRHRFECKEIIEMEEIKNE